MELLIPDLSPETRMAGLEHFMERYLGRRRPEFGTPEEELRLVEMPAPLERFFRFAGRWPGQNPEGPFANRFCIQDILCGFEVKGYASILRLAADQERLVFVHENQAVWTALTERSGVDPPVWIVGDEDRKLERPLSHFLVSFVLQESMFGSEIVAQAPRALEKFEEAGMRIDPLWLDGEYAWAWRPTYYLVGERFLLRRALEESDGADWYACNQSKGADELRSLRLPTSLDEEPNQRKKWWSAF